MTKFINPLANRRPNGFAARVAEIKDWTKTALSLNEDAVVSVNELACSQPGCPPKQVVVLILSEAASPRKFEIHKALIDTTQADVVEALPALVCVESPS